MARQRNYAREYAARTIKAQERGFSGYGQQRLAFTDVDKGMARLPPATDAKAKADYVKIKDLLQQGAADLAKQKNAGVPEKDRYTDPEIKGRLWGLLKHYSDKDGCKDIMRELY
jgi:hypothetical protein